MRAHLYNRQLFYILFLLCIISRIFTSIYYIEDIDSLRFAYSIVDEYNLLKLQPHFPGYAVFCFIANILYDLTGNLGITFSLIGGVSTFIIICFSLKLLGLRINSIEGCFTLLIIFFNPMVWLMSNRYMPDLLGLSLLIISFYFLSKQKQVDILWGSFLFGVLAGIRLSYIPFLFFPFIYILFFNNKKYQIIFSVFFGIIIWLIPMILFTGFENLILVAFKQTTGHFVDFGGTIITEDNWLLRIKYFINTLWSDGLGGYWLDRSIITLILSLLFLPIIILFIKNIKHILFENSTIKNLIISTLIYIVWILLFQNIIYKSRHLLPVVFVLIILFSYTFSNYIKNINNKIIYTILLIFNLCFVTFHLSSQHKNPTAISQIGKFLKLDNNSKVIVSTPLINYYLKGINLNAKYIDVNQYSDKIIIDSKNKSTFFIIGDFIEKINYESINISDTIFYHNPYVNRMWSSIKLYSNKKL